MLVVIVGTFVTGRTGVTIAIAVAIVLARDRCNRKILTKRDRPNNTSDVLDMHHPPYAAADRQTVVAGLSLILSMGLIAIATTATAHPPDRGRQTVRPRYDLIGPIGNRLSPGYRRRYNRPTDLGGRIAYKIAPSSQEAMAWHAAKHRGDYDCHRGAVVPYYEFARPWEALPVGRRRDSKAELPDNQRELPEDQQELLGDAPELSPEPLEELIEPMMEEVPLEDLTPPVATPDDAG